MATSDVDYCAEYATTCLKLTRARMVTHCDRCGSDWCDNGINSGCACARIAVLETSLHRAVREARVLRGIVQQDHPDELIVMRAMRKYHMRERRRRREAEAERDEARERIAELEAKLAALQSPEAPATTCPRCGGKGGA